MVKLAYVLACQFELFILAEWLLAAQMRIENKKD